MARLPGNLVPLCRLRHTLVVRQDAVETMEAFAQTGVGVKVFSADPPAEVSAALETAGLDLEAREDTPLHAISGTELAEMNAQHLGQAVSENTIFGDLSPEQAGLVVASLQKGGRSVAVVGDGVSDIPTLRQAGVAISRQSSSFHEAAS